MKRFLLVLLILLCQLFFASYIVLAVSENECLQKTGDEKIDCLTKLVTETNKKEESLTNEIVIFNANIALTTAKIQKTQNDIIKLQQEIESLTTKIDRLDDSLGHLSDVLLQRIVSTYKQGDIQPFSLLLSSGGFSDFLTRLKYIKIVQEHDKKLMFQMQSTKNTYSDQKQVRENKKQEQENLRIQLEAQKVKLAQQIKDREILLEVTRSDEVRYQQLLSAARAEQEARLRILAGGGNAVKIGEIKSGERIGSMLSGRSACSTGTHLHFEVAVGASTVNPANYLKNISLTYDYNTNNIPEFINAIGSWDWPIDEPVIIEQIYGMSYWARVLHYYNGGPHTGIDMNSGNGLNVKAVRDGTLYRGAISCGGGLLPFARVDQADNIQTYYLHIN